MGTAYSQENILDIGNNFLNNGKLDSAELTFKKGLSTDPNNLIYQSQLALVYINKKEFVEAEKILIAILDIDSLNVGAIWYSGIGNFKSGNDSIAISRFEKVLILLNKTDNQYASALWFIGNSYSNLLMTKGLSYQEISRMLECYEKYLEIELQAKDYKEITAFIELIKDKRPTKNVEKWVFR